MRPHYRFWNKFTFFANIWLTFSKNFYIICDEDEISRVWRYRLSYIREEAMRMLLEQVYLLYIYILLTDLAIVTVVTVSLFVALIVTIRKLDNEKNTSLPGR